MLVEIGSLVVIIYFCLLYNFISGLFLYAYIFIFYIQSVVFEICIVYVVHLSIIDMYYFIRWYVIDSTLGLYSKTSFGVYPYVHSSYT